VKLLNFLTVVAVAGVLAACAATPGPARVDNPAPAVVTPEVDPGAAAPPAAAPVPVVSAEAAKAKLLQQKREAQQQKQDLDDESARLASYQKNLFQVFKLTESTAGFQARPNAIGVFESKAARSGKMRVSLAQMPDSPARLAVGSYTINLNLLVEYVENRECMAGGCLGKTQKIVRSVPKTVQIAVSPKTAFTGSRELSFLDSENVEPNAKDVRISYSNLVMTVRRITVAAPVTRSD
jgi:flagellar motility protein MotE (MotC chaperone)